ncbi:hypothetical protein H6G36_04260 [Anabaena minutissima FACHB-250]|nr:hypothetical protein [Anabaena minutissima FACHB-250]
MMCCSNPSQTSPDSAPKNKKRSPRFKLVQWTAPHRRRSLLDFRGQQLLSWHIDHQNI